jgi:hypothetical protein
MGTQMMNPEIVQAEVTDRQQRLLAEAAARRQVRVVRARVPRGGPRPRFGRFLPGRFLADRTGRAGRAEVGRCVAC